MNYAFLNHITLSECYLSDQLLTHVGVSFATETEKKLTFVIVFHRNNMIANLKPTTDPIRSIRSNYFWFIFILVTKLNSFAKIGIQMIQKSQFCVCSSDFFFNYPLLVY